MLKEILTPTKLKIILAIVLALLTNFLAKILVFFPMAVDLGGKSGQILFYILLFILWVLDFGVMLTNYLSRIWIDSAHLVQSVFVAFIVKYLGLIFQFLYIYIVISILIYFKNQKKTVENNSINSS